MALTIKICALRRIHVLWNALLLLLLRDPDIINLDRPLRDRGDVLGRARAAQRLRNDNMKKNDACFLFKFESPQYCAVRRTSADWYKRPAAAAGA